MTGAVVPAVHAHQRPPSVRKGSVSWSVSLAVTAKNAAMTDAAVIVVPARQLRPFVKRASA